MPPPPFPPHHEPKPIASSARRRRVRPQRPQPPRGQLHRVRAGHAAPRRRLHARGVDDAQGRHDAPRRAQDRARDRRLRGREALPGRSLHRRAAPAPVRGQPEHGPGPGEGGAALRREGRDGREDGDCRARRRPGAPLFRRGAVPPRVQVEAREAEPAVPGAGARGRREAGRVDVRQPAVSWAGGGRRARGEKGKDGRREEGQGVGGRGGCFRLFHSFLEREREREGERERGRESARERGKTKEGERDNREGDRESRERWNSEQRGRARCLAAGRGEIKIKKNAKKKKTKFPESARKKS